MRVCLELNSTPVVLKTKREWPSTLVEVTRKKEDHETSVRYKTFIFDRQRGIKLIKDVKTGAKKRVKITCLANGQWRELAFSGNGGFVAVIQQDLAKEHIVRASTLDMNKSHRETTVPSPSNFPIRHVSRNDDGNVLLVDHQGVLFIENRNNEENEQWSKFDSLNLVTTEHTQFASRFDVDHFLVMVATQRINTVNVHFITGQLDGALDCVEYALPLRPERLTRICIAIAPDRKTVALCTSYRLPHLSEVLFVNVTTGTHIASSLRGAECPLQQPTEREASRFAIKSCSFSQKGRLLFGCNDNGSIFGMVTCGALLPLKMNGASGSGEEDFLCVQPLSLASDDLVTVPKVAHSLFVAENDAIVSFSDGHVVHLIKYPKLDTTIVGFSNPFLMQLINSAHELLEAVKRGACGGNEKTLTPMMKTYSQESLVSISKRVGGGGSVTETFKRIRAKLTKSVTRKKSDASPRLAASTLNLERFQHGLAHSDSDDSDQHDAEMPKKPFKLFQRSLSTERSQHQVQQQQQQRLGELELLQLFRDTIRTIVGFVTQRDEELGDDESDQIIELIAKYAEVNVILAQRGLDYDRIETLFRHNLDITLHMAHLTSWDASQMRQVHLLARMIELFLCLSGELLVRHLHVAAAVAHFESVVDKSRIRFRGSYTMEIDLVPVWSSLYALLQREASVHPGLVSLKQACHAELSRAGVAPLKLPTRKELIDSTSAKMSQCLVEYDIDQALDIVMKTAKKQLKGDSPTGDESKAIGTFISAMVNFVCQKPILIPSPSSPRLIRLEAELVEKVLHKNEQINPLSIIHLTLLTGHFQPVADILTHLNAAPTLLCLAAIDAATKTQLTQLDCEFNQLLASLARSRIERHFEEMKKDADFGLESKWTCTTAILSPLVLGSVQNTDLISTLLKDQISLILDLLRQSGAGKPESGPFAPIVLLQPKDDNEEEEELKRRFELSNRLRFAFSILAVTGLDRAMILKYAQLIVSRQTPRHYVQLLLAECEETKNGFSWDAQTKSIFSLLRVLFAFLWVIFLRDQFKAALYRYGATVKGSQAEADGFYRPDQAALDILEACSQLYQFSDVLMCKNDIHTAALTAAFEFRPTESTCRKLARLFYNVHLVTQTNLNKLDRLKGRLEQFDTAGMPIARSESGNTCCAYFDARCDELSQRDVMFHSIGETSASFVQFFSQTKFKLYEKSADYLNFIGGQVHLLFANSTEMGMCLVQTRQQLMEQLDVHFSKANHATPRQQSHKWTNGLETTKAEIKEQLREVLESSVNSSPRNRKSTKWSSLRDLSEKSTFTRPRSNSTKTLKSFSVGKSPVMRSFLKQTHPSKTTSDTTSSVSLANFVAWAKSDSELEFLLATPGGESYITRPIRVLFAWLRYDCDVMQQGAGGIELDARCVELGLLLLDLKTRKTLSKDIVALNRRLTKQAENELNKPPSLPLSPTPPVVKDTFVHVSRSQVKAAPTPPPPPPAKSPGVAFASPIEDGESFELPKLAEPVRSAPPPPQQQQQQQEEQQQPVLLTQQMALLTQMVSLMQQNMLTQQSMAQPQHNNKIKSRNPIFTCSTRHLTSKRSSGHVVKRTRSTSPVKLVKHARGIDIPSKTRTGLTLLEIGTVKRTTKESEQKTLKMQLLNRKHVANHVQSKKRTKEPKLDKFLRPKAPPEVHQQQAPTKKALGPSTVLEMEKENTSPVRKPKVQIQAQAPAPQPEPMVSTSEIERRLRDEFEKMERRMNAMTIDEIRRRARENVSLIDDDVFVAPKKTSDGVTPTKTVKELAAHTKPQIESRIDKTSTPPPPDAINSTKLAEPVISPPHQNSLEAANTDATKDTAKPIVTSIDDSIDDQLAQLNLDELNSLHDDIGERAQMNNYREMPNLDQRNQKRVSLFDKALDSARRREGDLVYNTSKRDEEAIKLAEEAIELTKRSSKLTTPKSKSKTKLKKKSSSNLASKQSSPYLLRHSRSHSAPPKKKKSSTVSVIDPYREAPAVTRERNVPNWRPLTRMEAYTGRGLYTNNRRKKPATPTKFKHDGTPRTVGELSQLHGFTGDKPKVRSVSEILEQTRVVVDSAREVSRNDPDDDKDVYAHYSPNENADLDGPINAQQLARSLSVESGLTNVQSLIDEIDKEHRKYCNELINEQLSGDDIVSR